jgi:hypothetical protein
MPTDIVAVYARKRMGQALTRADFECVVLFVLIGLLCSFARLI